MSEPIDTFESLFKALTGHGPYPWQGDLFDRWATGKPVLALDVPTGLGKTSVVPIWLCAHLLGKRPPMRLVYVVNRRTIVDQATNEAERFAAQLNRGGPLHALWHERFPDGLMPVSTVRGGKADNRDWLLAPHRPAVVVGTVDMIGSRLLFGGYRTGRWQRSRHAGLIGQDTLLVHDEAHLSKPFHTLLDWVTAHQSDPARPMRVLPMSATAAVARTDVLSITQADRDQAAGVLTADKRVTLHEPQQDLETQLAVLAARHKSATARVIVFVRRPDQARKVVQRLTAKPDPVEAGRIELLTGTIRGQERDALVEKDVLRHLLKGWQGDTPRTEYLIATSAGEVGADFDADHLVCDLSTIDAMIQRFGRVNRRGGDGRVAQVDVVLDRPVAKVKKVEADAKASDIDVARLASAAFLSALAAEQPDGVIDASPAAITGDPSGRPAWRTRAGYAAACEPVVPTVEPHPATLDAWSLTSVQEDWPVAREVEPYLHGVESDPPQAFLAWRAELDELPAVGTLDRKGLEQLFKWHPLLPRELVQDRPDVVAGLLLAVRDRSPDAAVVLMRGRRVELVRLSDRDRLPDDPKALKGRLAYTTVVLPTRVGGLTQAGMIEAASADPVPDVADVASPPDQRTRYVLTRDAEDGTWRHRLLLPTTEGAEAVGDGTHPEGFDRWTDARDAVTDAIGMRLVGHVVLAADDEGPTKRLLLYGGRRDRKTKTDPPTVDAHNGSVKEAVERRTRTLWPDGSDEAKALVFAAKAHDLGKAWNAGDGRWQEAAQNKDPDRSVAKSSGVLNARLLDGYRHEFGSLVKAVDRPVSPAARELALHLIATHHGRGRPHFEVDAMKVVLAQLAADLTPAAIACRFDRLQRQYGHWGLAWLESVLMSADGQASADGDEPKGEEL